MKKAIITIGFIAFASVVSTLVCSCDSGTKRNSYYNYGSTRINTNYPSDGLSELEKAQREAQAEKEARTEAEQAKREARRAEEDARQQTIDFLNKAYGYDVSSYVD